MNRPLDYCTKSNSNIKNGNTSAYRSKHVPPPTILCLDYGTEGYVNCWGSGFEYGASEAETMGG